MRKTMKRLLSIVCILALCTALAACQNGAQQATTSQSPAATPTPQTPTPTPSQAPKTPEVPMVTYVQPDEAAVEQLNAMQPVYDSIVRILMERPQPVMENGNPDFFWGVLYHLCANYGELFPEVEPTGSQYIVPAVLMQQLARACFAEDNALMEVPAQTFDIVYDDDRDAYFVGLSDAGDTYTKVLGYRQNSLGEVEATVGYMVHGEEEYDQMLAAFIFILTPDAQSTESSIFRYSVVGAAKEFTDLISVQSFTKKGDKQYAVIDLYEKIAGASGSEPTKGEGSPVEVLISARAVFAFNQFDKRFPSVSVQEVNEDNSRAFFIEKAVQKEGPAFFYANISDGVLYGGEFAWDCYPDA